MFHEKMLVTHQNLSFATIDEIGLQSNTKQTNNQTNKPVQYEFSNILFGNRVSGNITNEYKQNAR